MQLLVALSLRTPLGQIMLSIFVSTLLVPLSDVAYIASRVISGHKTARQALAGLAASVVTAILIMLFGATVAAYQLLSSGSSLDLSDESLVIINCVLYPILVCASKRALLGLLRARVSRDRLDYVGVVTIVLQIAATAPQAYTTFGFDGVSFLASLVVGQLLELGLALLNARSAGALEAVRGTLERTVSSRSFKSSLASFGSAKVLPHIASTKGSHSTFPAIKISAEPQTTSASTVARPARQTSTAVLIAIQVAHAAPGELIGILCAAAVVAIVQGLSTEFWAKAAAMLVAELITDDLSVLIYHRYRIWVRRVRVQVPRLSVLSVVFGAVASSLLALLGLLWVCQLGSV
jgi:hypothetical protein